MSKLLRANFYRLFRSRLFWFCTAAIFAMAVLAVINQAKYNKILDGMLFSGITIISVASAVFISIFIGTEYSDSTLRNKLYLGHSRSAVYAANLITCAAAAIIFHIILITAIVCFGVPIIGSITIPASEIILLFLLSVLIVTAYASVYIVLGMLINSKSAGAIAAALLSFSLIIGANTLYRIINTPEYRPVPYVDEKSETGYSTEFVPNQRYLTGIKRKVAEILFNILPSGQALQISSGELPKNSAEIPLYAFLDIAVTTAAGIILFRRKDLK